MARHYDLHRLRLLRELKHRGTITAVAAAMSYSHSAVSQQLATLEAEVGTALLEPDGRRVRLTPAAEILITHVDAVLERLDEADADLARTTGEIAGRFRIGTFQTAMMALIPSLLATLKKAHPRLTVEVAHADPDAALSGLQGHDFDLVVDEVFAGQSLTRSSAVDQTILLRDPLRLAVPAADSSLAGAEQLADLAHADWVLEPQGSQAREWADRICNAAGFRPNVRFESPDMFEHERLVRAGHAVAFLPDLLWAATRPTIRLHELPQIGYRDVVCSVRAGTSHHPAVSSVTEALRAICPEVHNAINANLRDRTTHAEPGITDIVAP